MTRLKGKYDYPPKIEIIVFMYSFSPTLALHKMFFILYMWFALAMTFANQQIFEKFVHKGLSLAMDLNMIVKIRSTYRLTFFKYSLTLHMA